MEKQQVFLLDGLHVMETQLYKEILVLDLRGRFIIGINPISKEQNTNFSQYSLIYIIKL